MPQANGAEWGAGTLAALPAAYYGGAAGDRTFGNTPGNKRAAQVGGMAGGALGSYFGPLGEVGGAALGSFIGPGIADAGQSIGKWLGRI